MYLNAIEQPWKAAMYAVMDINTMQIIPRVLWVDEEQQIYGQYVCDENLKIILVNGEPSVEIKKGNIRLVEK